VRVLCFDLCFCFCLLPNLFLFVCNLHANSFSLWLKSRWHSNWFLEIRDSEHSTRPWATCSALDLAQRCNQETLGGLGVHISFLSREMWELRITRQLFVVYDSGINRASPNSNDYESVKFPQKKRGTQTTKQISNSAKQTKTKPKFRIPSPIKFWRQNPDLNKFMTSCPLHRNFWRGLIH